MQIFSFSTRQPELEILSTALVQEGTNRCFELAPVIHPWLEPRLSSFPLPPTPKVILGSADGDRGEGTSLEVSFP